MAGDNHKRKTRRRRDLGDEFELHDVTAWSCSHVSLPIELQVYCSFLLCKVTGTRYQCISSCNP